MKTKGNYLKSLPILVLLITCIVFLIRVPVVLADEPGETVINVTDYGADPSGKKESTTAVWKAIEYAKTLPENSKKRIFFPKGEYHFYADYAQVRKLYVSNTVGADQRYANKHIGILLEDMKNVTVDGGDSLFMYHGDITTFAAIRSENVTFEKFGFDHASPSVVDVTVESKVEGENAVVAYIPESYNYTISGNTINWSGEKGPVTGTPYWQGRGALGYTQIFDTVSGKTWRGGNTLFSNVKSITELGNNRVKFTYNGAQVPQTGYCFQMRNTTRTTPGALFWESRNVTVQDVNAYFMHGFGMVGQLSKDITIDNVKFKARPGTGRTTAGFADFIQMSSVGGKVTIKNSEFSNPHDDPINIHGTFLTVNTVSADKKTFELKYRHDQTAGFPQYYVGDTIDFSTKGTMIPVQDSTRKVVSVNGPNEGSLDTITITLDKPVDGITGGNNSFVVENVTYTPEVEISNNRFIETPTRGVLVSTRKPVVIEGNYFDAMGMSSIFISCDAQGWYESGHTENVLIRNNVFDRPSGSTIYVYPTGSNDPIHQIHSNMRIEDNVFNIESNQTIFSVKSVNGLTIQNNIINRYNPDITLDLSAENKTIEAGKTEETRLTSNGTQFNNALYYFEASKNILVKDNQYDSGFNQRINLGQYTSASDVKIEGDDVSIGENNQKAAIGTIQYLSSNKKVATVDSQGVITGKSAGSADIYAYTVSGVRAFESNKVTIKVTGTSVAETRPDSVEVLSDADTITDPGGTLQLQSRALPAGKDQTVSWSVRDAQTKGNTNAATIDQNGLLTAVSSGIVEVIAASKSDAGVYGIRLISIMIPTTGKSSRWTVVNDRSSWTVSDHDQLTIQAKSGGSWATGSGASNVFLTDIPAGKTNFEVTVRLDNKTKGSYEEAGIVFFKDHDNYVMLERKHNNGSPKLAVTTESNGSPSEDPRINDIDADVVYFKLVKEANTYTGYYSLDQTTWVRIRQVTNTTLGADFRIGIIATNSTANTPFTFEDFKVDGSKIPFMNTNHAPVIKDASVNQQGAVLTAVYTFQDEDQDTEGNSIYRWFTSSASDGAYKVMDQATQRTLTVNTALGSKYVRAEIVPVDQWGKAGPGVFTDPIQIPEQEPVPDNANLTSLDITGAELLPVFDGNITTYSVTVPSSAGQMSVQAVPAESAGTVALQLNGNAVSANEPFEVPKRESTLVITVTAPDKVTVKTYTIQIDRIPDSDAFLKSMDLKGIDGSLNFNKTQMFYSVYTTGDLQSLKLSASTEQSSTSVFVSANGKTLADYTSDTVSDLEIPLVTGLNQIEVRTRAEDGYSAKYYRIVFSRVASTNAQLSDIKMNGTTIAGFDPAVTSYRLTSLPQTVSFEAAPADSRAMVRTIVNGTEAQSCDLKPGLNKVEFIVTAENTTATRTYTVYITVSQKNNADLFSLEAQDLTLSPEFSADTTDYSVHTSGSTVSFKAVAVEEQASVTIETDADIFDGGNTLTQQVNIYSGENKIQITVTAPDKKTTKVYHITVISDNTVYLSDLDWVSASAGDSGWNGGIPAKDSGWEGYDLSLTGADGQKVPYQKGVGTHANSEIVYDIVGKGYTRFKSDIGVSYKKNTSSEPHLVFQVLLDGQAAYTSDVMNGNTPFVSVDLDISNVSTITLKVTQEANIWSAHGNWADARFIGAAVAPPERYSINPGEQTDAVVRPDKKLAVPGDTVTVNVSGIAARKELKGLRVVQDDDNSTEVPVTPVTDHLPEGTFRFQFTMPATNVKLIPQLADVILVSADPVIEVQPLDQTVSEGAAVSFKVQAKSSDGGTITYQWQTQAAGASSAWIDIVSANNAEYKFSGAAMDDNGRQFRCLVTNTKENLTPSTTVSSAAVLAVSKAGTTDRKIISIITPYEVRVEKGTAVSNLKLPETVSVLLEDQSAAEVPVNWNMDPYNGEKAGEYELTGTLIPGAGIINSNQLKTSIHVIVLEPLSPPQPQPDKTALSSLLNAARVKTEDSRYTGKTRDLLKKAIAAAKTVADLDKATAEEIEKAVDTLQSAITGLEKKSVKKNQPLTPAQETSAGNGTVPAGAGNVSATGTGNTANTATTTVPPATVATVPDQAKETVIPETEVPKAGNQEKQKENHPSAAKYQKSSNPIRFIGISVFFVLTVLTCTLLLILRKNREK